MTSPQRPISNCCWGLRLTYAPKLHSDSPRPSPPPHAQEIVYFIRPESQQLTSTNIGELVEFGCLNGTAAHSLLRLMNGVFSAQIFKTTAWPDSVKKDFTGHYHRFMASLTESANSAKVSGTHTYTPPLIPHPSTHAH